MSKNDIIERLRQNPGAIAEEVGCTPVEMNRLYDNGNGPVVKVGLRKTGKRGRPPVEWALKETLIERAQAKSAASTLTDNLPPVGAPKLPIEEMDHVRHALDSEQVQQVSYIEQFFTGKKGRKPQPGDFNGTDVINNLKMLKNRYDEILKAARKKSAARRARVQAQAIERELVAA